MELTRWILVAGTGRHQGLSPQVALLAEAVGRALAERGFGLVVGGWPGVDYLAARGFAAALKSKALPLADYLIQVVAEKRPVLYPPGADYPDFKGGYITAVPPGAREWIEAIKFADAVMLLGGEGGTLETYYYANQEQRPVFPFPGTGGDAAQAFADIMERWEYFPYKGFSRKQFMAALTQPNDHAEKSARRAHAALDLVQAQFAREDAPRDHIFVSYAHEDRPWLIKLRSALRPLEKKAKLSVWDDTTLQPSDAFRTEISQAIHKSKAAILLVSDSFFASEFIQEYELPPLLERSRQGAIRLFWLLLAGNKWQKSPLADILSVNEVGLPLNALSPARQQDLLVLLRKSLAAALA